jgi:DNA-binding SARP family transcriptional activator
MIFQEITRVSLDSFRERSKGYKVVLLYPWTNYRTLFLSYFLSGVDNGLLYYRIPADETTLTGWLRGLVKEFDEVLEGFGKQTRPAIEKNNPADMGTALAHDLSDYARKKDVVLYIDELDRVPHDEAFEQFTRALVAGLPNNIQLSFSSRLLTHQPWYDMVSRREALVLGTEYRKNDVMFAVEDAPRPQLEIYALGRGYALVNGQPITNWDGALPRNLFFYFVDRPLVTRDEIFQTFWPDLSVKEATNVFHVTKRKISERITMKVGGTGSYELTQYNGGFYLPSEKVVRHYDVADFQEAVERALVASTEHEEETLLRRAIDAYKAPFLQNIDMEWTRNRRDHLRQLYAQALVSMGRLTKARHDDEQALGFYVRSLKEAPEREDIHREVMSIYIQLNRFEDARSQYNRLTQILDETLHIAPSRETRELYSMIEGR